MMYNYKVEDFVENITNKSSFDCNDMVKICKRKNNNKRQYLFVNKYQAKHIPSLAADTLKLFDELYAEIVKNINKDRKILIIGFAETATAISQRVAHMAVKNGDINMVYYIQTTREEIETPNKTITFEEQHSHATTQKLYLSEDVPEYDTVLFVEDEVTTGKTILNFIEKFRKINSNTKFAVASILNWQNASDKKTYQDMGIKRICLIEGQIKKNIPDISLEPGEVKEYLPTRDISLVISSRLNPRTGLTKDEFKEFISDIETKISGYSSFSKGKVTVIGTEENMYSAILVASKIGNNAVVRSTTRSPITVSKESGYNIYNGIQIPSLYNSERTTYLYDIDKTYNSALIISEEINTVFMENISTALKDKGVSVVTFAVINV